MLIVKVAGKRKRRRRHGGLNSNFCGFLFCEACIQKSYKGKKNRTIRICQTCNVNKLKQILWKPYWQKIERIEEVINEKIDVLEELKEKALDKQNNFNSHKEKQSSCLRKFEIEVNDLVKQKDIFEEEMEKKNNVLKILGEREHINDELIMERNNERLGKEKEMADLEADINSLNKQNNSFLKEKNIILNDIKRIINKVYEKRNLDKRFNIDNKMQRGYDKKNKRSMMLFKSGAGNKKRKHKNPADFSCRCLIF